MRAGCDKTYVMYGDPIAFSQAHGFTCMFDDATMGSVSFRNYESPRALVVALNDWGSAVSVTNQIAVGDTWFATGPEDVLEKMLRDVKHSRPSKIAPAAVEPTETEFKQIFCSTTVYDRLLSGAGGGIDSELENQFPGMTRLLGRLAPEPVSNPADDLARLSLATEDDAAIKEYCRNLPQ